MEALPHNENLKVLLAEDEWLLSWSLERHLVRLGIEVSIASTGEQALKLFETDNFDWLITDLKLPEKDGFELISAARKIRPTMRAILITAYGSTAVEEKARKLGALYVSKPFDLDVIARLVLPDRTAAAT